VWVGGCARVMVQPWRIRRGCSSRGWRQSRSSQVNVARGLHASIISLQLDYYCSVEFVELGSCVSDVPLVWGFILALSLGSWVRLLEDLLLRPRAFVHPQSMYLFRVPYLSPPLKTLLGFTAEMVRPACQRWLKKPVLVVTHKVTSKGVRYQTACMRERGRFGGLSIIVRRDFVLPGNTAAYPPGRGDVTHEEREHLVG